MFATSRLRRLGGEAVWIGLGQIAVVLGALLGVRVLTELLPPSAYGELALALTLAMLVNQILMGPLSAAATRFYSLAEVEQAMSPYLTALRRLMLVATLAVGAIGLVVAIGGAWAGRLFWVPLALVTLAFAILSGYNSILSGVQNAARHRAIVALHQGAASIGRFLVAAALILIFGATSSVAMLGYFLAMVLILASQYLFFRRRIVGPQSGEPDPRVVLDWRNRMQSYAWPFVTLGIFYWAHLISDRWALGVFASTDDVGLFAAVYQLGYYPMTIVTSVMTQLVWPILYKRAGNLSDDAKTRKIFGTTNRMAIGVALVSLSIFFVALLAHNWVFEIFVADEYHSVSWLLPWMLLGGGLYATGQVLSLRLEIELKSSLLARIKFVSAVFGVVVNIIGARYFGIEGVVAANVIYSLFYVAMFVILGNKESSTLLRRTCRL